MRTWKRIAVAFLAANRAMMWRFAIGCWSFLGGWIISDEYPAIYFTMFFRYSYCIVAMFWEDCCLWYNLLLT